MELSIVIPVFNEEGNIRKLFYELKEVLKSFLSWEVIFVDDGSTDRSFSVCKELHEEDDRFKAIRFRRNYGQTEALVAGINFSTGRKIVTLDGDLQNDPFDIPALLNELDKGYDMVAGWRHRRKDSLSKKIISKIGRYLRFRLLKIKIHDSGCTLRAYNADIIKELDLRGEMHRYIAEIAVIHGFRVGEIRINHRARSHGKSKYNVFKLPKGFLDLLIIFYQARFATRPIHLFGGIGLFFIFIGLCFGAYLTYIKFILQASIANRPLLLFSIFLLIFGFQMIILGMITEVITQLNKGEKSTSYKILEIIE